MQQVAHRFLPAILCLTVFSGTALGADSPATEARSWQPVSVWSDLDHNHYAVSQVLSWTDGEHKRRATLDVQLPPKDNKPVSITFVLDGINTAGSDTVTFSHDGVSDPVKSPTAPVKRWNDSAIAIWLGPTQLAKMVNGRKVVLATGGTTLTLSREQQNVLLAYVDLTERLAESLKDHPSKVPAGDSWAETSTSRIELAPDPGNPPPGTADKIIVNRGGEISTINLILSGPDGKPAGSLIAMQFRGASPMISLLTTTNIDHAALQVAGVQTPLQVGKVEGPGPGRTITLTLDQLKQLATGDKPELILGAAHVPLSSAQQRELARMHDTLVHAQKDGTDAGVGP